MHHRQKMIQSSNLLHKAFPHHQLTAKEVLEMNVTMIRDNRQKWHGWESCHTQEGMRRNNDRATERGKSERGWEWRKEGAKSRFISIHKTDKRREMNEGTCQLPSAQRDTPLSSGPLNKVVETLLASQALSQASVVFFFVLFLLSSGTSAFPWCFQLKPLTDLFYQTSGIVKGCTREETWSWHNLHTDSDRLPGPAQFAVKPNVHS